MVAASPGLAEESTLLGRYVASPDPNYHYDLISTIPGDGYTGFVLEMTSQQWRTAAEVDRPIWKHWLNIVVPQQLKTRIGALVISGGSIFSKPPARINPLAAALAKTTGSVAARSEGPSRRRRARPPLGGRTDLKFCFHALAEFPSPEVEPCPCRTLNASLF